MAQIKINKNNVLILKTDSLLHNSHLKEIREDILQQINSGVVIIPCGFTYEILERNILLLEGEQ